VVLLLGATSAVAESPTVHIEYQARVDETGGLRYVFAEGTMSGTVRGTASYTVPVQIHYPVEGGNGTAVLELTNSALLEGRTRRRLSYGRIERASDGYEIVRDAARWRAAPGALTGDAPPVSSHDHVIAYGLSGSGYLLRDYLIRGKNAGGEIDGFFVHAAGSKCLALIDDKVGSPRVYHWSTCRGPTPTNGAKVLAVDAQSDLEFNAGALAREGAVDDPDYVRWEVAGAPHVPVFAMDLTRLGAPQQNPMDWSPIWRSAFHYLDRWVKHGTAPPTAPPITGRWEDEDTWKCDLDADGNALGGIRLPPIEAPRGIYTGFDYSWLDPAVSKGHRFAIVFAYGGRFERFSDETLAERYPTEADYRKSFEAAARRAFDAGYILEEDLRRYTAAPPRDQFFDSAGVTIRYIDVGPRDGEPVVLIHGAFNSVEGHWSETGVIDALDDDYRVIALDLRGHGKSEKPHDPAQYGAEFASDVIRLLDHLSIEKAHIAGYSMGGHITFKLVADHPERLRSAMPCGDGGRAASGAFADAVHRTIASLDAPGSMRPLLDYFVTPGSMTAEQVDALDATICAANDNGAMAAMLRNWQGMDTEPAKLAANRVPCLAVIGQGDPLRADLQATAERMPNLRVEIMRGHDHMTAFQDPGMAAAIKAFVGAHASVDARRGAVPGCEMCALLAPGARFLGGPLESDDLIVHESESFVVYVHPGDQRYLGRCVVVLKRHAPSLAALSPAEWDDLQAVIEVMEDAARGAFGAVHFSWTCLMNNSFREDPPRPHVHLHFRPRYATAVEFQGSWYEDARFGEHYDREKVPPTTATTRAVGAALRKAVEQVR
jgi:pimeloyl-ACP methyl ester carboxylesterase/diadenosine tetraphosphate (Ap4A) HIT family hydrolase